MSRLCRHARACVRLAALLGIVGVVGLWLGSPGCVGVEADVLSLRPAADLAEPVDLRAEDFPDLAPASPCMAEWLSGMSCEPASTWKSKAAAVCMASMRLIGRIDLRDTCDLRGVLGARGVSFDCCESPPPPPPCVTRLQGDMTSCKGAATWQRSAALDCQSRGELLEAFSPYDPCFADGYRAIKYMCCRPGRPEAGAASGAGGAKAPAPGSLRNIPEGGR